MGANFILKYFGFLLVAGEILLTVNKYSNKTFVLTAT